MTEKWGVLCDLTHSFSLFVFYSLGKVLVSASVVLLLSSQNA